MYANTGDDARFFELVNQSQQRYPQQVWFKTEYARSLFHRQQYSEVIGFLLNAELLDASQHALLAAAYQRKEQHQKAVEHYHYALKLDKNQAKNWIGLGISLEHEAELGKALRSYQTALRIGNLNDKLTQFVQQRSKLLKKVVN